MKKKTFTLIMGLLLTALGAAAQNSGTTGPLTWNYNAGTKTLSITGKGEMPNYASPWKAFRDEIKTVTIGNGVTTIGDYAFYLCGALQNITLPVGVTKIGSNAFDFCKKLSGITLPAGLLSINDAAFARCDALQSIDIPTSVTAIGEMVFFGSDALQAIGVDAGNTHFVSVDGVLYNKAKTELLCYPAGKSGTAFTLPAEVKKIGDFAFAICKQLQNITLPTGVKEIGVEAFYSCTALKSIAIPGTVTTIGRSAFYSCRALKSIRIPSAVSSIGGNAFNSCTALTEVIVGWDTPLAIDENVFRNVTLSGVTLKVPKGTKAKYQAAPVWKDFKINETTANQTVDGLRVFAAAGALRLTLPKAETVHIYHVSGALVKTLTLSAGDHVQPLPSGVYLVQTGERVTKILIK